jgi:hypothetical protein
MIDVQQPWEVVEVCRATLERLRETGGEPPVFQAIDGPLRQRGVARPDAHVLAARASGHLAFEGELNFPTEILLPVPGHFLADPRDRLLHHYFVPVVRSLVDRLDRETLISPTEAQRIIVFAHEMEQLRGATPNEVRMLGRLLDIEPIGLVEWDADPSSPWGIEINFRIRDFANIASVVDYLEISQWSSL